MLAVIASLEFCSACLPTANEELPPEFCWAIFAGKKRYSIQTEVAVLNVSRYREFTLDPLYIYLSETPAVMSHLPELDMTFRRPFDDWAYRVAYTQEPLLMEKVISAAIRRRMTANPV